ncbi:MAG TPA: ABC transporter ATP-binding protein [Gemmatimonadaceae bacterium]
MIEIAGVSKCFGDVRVLSTVTTSFQRGRVTALVGPNAAGKTTLIKTILGLVRADSGEIRIDGEPADADGAYRSRVGYMPQIARYPENLTGAELIEFLTDLRGGVGHVALDETLIDRLRVREFLDKPLKTLSGGTRQKINAAAAFLFRPSILILDEPTAGLDPLSSSLLKDAIAERDVGRTVVVTSHVMGELEQVADDVVFLLEGRVRFAGSMAALKEETRQATLERAVAHMMIRQTAEAAA